MSERKCPFCAEDVQTEALVCRYCGADLAAGKPATTRSGSSVWDGVKIGTGLFIVLPILLAVGAVGAVTLFAWLFWPSPEPTAALRSRPAAATSVEASAPRLAVKYSASALARISRAPREEKIGHLYRAVNRGDAAAVGQLLTAGVPVRVRDSSGLTLLMIAVDQGEPEVVRRLVEAGADVRARTADGLTPLSIARKRGDEALVSYLSERGAR